MKLFSPAWSGNNTDARQIATPFRPKAVILVPRTFVGGYNNSSDNNGACCKLDTMAGDTAKPLGGGTARALVANLIQAFADAYFEVGTDTLVNVLTEEYSALVFGDDPDVVTGTYVGNGTSQVIAGVGFRPGLVLVMGAGTQFPSYAVDGLPDTHGIGTSDGAVVTSELYTLNDDGFAVGNHSTVNTNGVTYHYLCLKKSAGIFDYTTFTGNSTDNRDITNPGGFDPDNVWLRAIAGATGKSTVLHLKAVAAGTDLSARLNDADSGTNLIQARGTGNAQVGSSSVVNQTGSTQWIGFFKDGDNTPVPPAPAGGRIPRHRRNFF